MVKKYSPDVIADRRRQLLEGFVSGLVPYVGGALVSALRINKPLQSEADLLDWIEQATVELNSVDTKISAIDQRIWANGVIAINDGFPAFKSSSNISCILDEGIGIYSVNFISEPSGPYQVAVQSAHNAQVEVENSRRGFRVKLSSRDGQPIDSEFSFQVTLHRP